MQNGQAENRVVTLKVRRWRMAVQMEERPRMSRAFDTRPSWGIATAKHFRRDEGRHGSPLSWLAVAGEFVLGLGLTLLGLLMSVALIACLIAAPFIAVASGVLLFALAIEAAPVLILVVLGMLLVALAMEAMGWWPRAERA